MAVSAFISMTASKAAARPKGAFTAPRIVIFLKNKSFSKIFCVIHFIFLETRQILLTRLNCLKFFSNAASIGDDHHKYDKTGTKHALIDRLQS
ncbi:hypothetical protein OAU31_03300 [Alphaproteobacteria bacterium]|nr:hypothetical protein [Alphaproteobacteria bacterium]MDC3193424.1 hypothetical protein [Alphaproteobacteria bacterium]